MKFPEYRGRRMRGSANIRRMVRETIVTPDNFIYPMFVTFGKNVKDEISSMPGNYRLSVDNLSAEVKEVESSRHTGDNPFRHTGDKRRTGNGSL